MSNAMGPSNPNPLEVGFYLLWIGLNVVMLITHGVSSWGLLFAGFLGYSVYAGIDYLRREVL